MSTELCQAISKLAFAIAGVIAIVGAMEVYIKMNIDDDVRWLIVRIVVICVCLAIIGEYFKI
jgi:Mn2+/Fe2+ NRAMP family transporter